MTPKKQYYENLADSLIEKFNMRGIEGYYCNNKEEALATAKRFLTPGCSVSWGGSMTLNEIGLMDALKSSDYVLYDRAAAVTPDAPAILSGGRVMGEGELTDAEKLDLIVDNAELCSCRRRIRQIRVELSASGTPDDRSESLFQEATELQRRVGELSRRISSVSTE